MKLEFEISATSDREFVIMPLLCELFLYRYPYSNLYIGNAPIYRQGSSSQILQDIKVGPTVSCMLHSNFELGFQNIYKLDELRRKTEKKDVRFLIGIYGWTKTDKDEIKSVGTYIEGVTIAESEWVDWQRKWGKEIRLVLVSGGALKRFEELKKLWNADDSELVALMTDKLSGTKLIQEPEFICTLPDKRTIETKIRDVLARALDVDEVLITGWTDQTLEPELKTLRDHGVKIRLVLGSGETKQPARSVQDAASRLTHYGIEIRNNDWAHARLIIGGNREVIISSADLKADSLSRNREAGVYSTNPTVVRQAIDFFERIWQEGEVA